MDQEQLKLLTKIQIQGKKLMGMEIDIVRLSSDRAYATEILKKLSSSDNEELVMTSIDFMAKLGLLKAEASSEPAKPAPEPQGDPLLDKYTRSLR